MVHSPHEVFVAVRASGKETVLLESGGGVGGWGARGGSKDGWSFVGVVNPEVKVPRGEAGLRFMREFLRKNRREKKLEEPPFVRGFVGFLSYELGAKWQGTGSVKRKAQSAKHEYPEAHFAYVDEVIAFRPRDMRAKIGEKILTAAVPDSNLTKQEYFEKIRRIKNYLYSGDTYQVNFSQRFEAPYTGDAFALYKTLTRINPSPFQFFLETPRFAVVSNSPERLFVLRRAHGGKIIETRPIKGTVSRGRTRSEESRNIKYLLASPKERAELAMIVDLERNDLGKICAAGTVEVNEPRTVEKYSYVIHTVANIRGTLENKYDWYDALHALFPGGSVTGCPKKRTMEIIKELEDGPRGVYCGSAGYIDLSGECDFNIMIRTLWLDKGENRRRLIFRSGGGIVVDSDPQKEYEETLHKSQALILSEASSVIK